MKKNLTSSVYTFEDIISDKFLYIDKTEYLWKLISRGKGMYFLSRPRRFGKSLTVSTLKAIFQGKKELFEGLAIYDKPYDWKSYPVIHLDIGNSNTTDPVELHNYLHAQLKNIAASFGLNLRGENLATDFQFLIEDLAQTAPVVILVDEYDKPIIESLTTPAAKDMLRVLKGFYSTIKTCSGKIRFAFVTGVTKFCHVSIFSDLNNLLDISLNADYAAMLGYTQQEFERNFAEWIAETEAKQKLPHAEYLAKIKEWYDGYRFEENAESVYNPVSLANFFLNGGKFSNYWFATGTPTFLMNLIKQNHLNLEKVLSEPASAFDLSSFEIDNLPPLTLMIQTGYLTIKSAEDFFGQTGYWLDFPNREVEESFNVHLLNACTGNSRNETSNFYRQFTIAVAKGDMKKFRQLLESFFAGISYDVHHKDEANFQNIFYTIFKLLNCNVHAESRTSDGRIDAVIETADNVYIFEFKLDKDPTAMAQIMEKEYYKQYQFSGKAITLFGVNFDTETGKICNWQEAAADSL